MKKSDRGQWGVKNKAQTAACLQQLLQVLRAPVTQTNCTSRSRHDRELPLRAVAVVYERATSLAAGDPIRGGSSFLGLDKTLQGLLYATHRDLVAGVRKMAFKVTLKKDSVIPRSSFGLGENVASGFRFCQIELLKVAETPVLQHGNHTLILLGEELTLTVTRRPIKLLFL